jgi:hypothetical protein
VGSAGSRLEESGVNIGEFLDLEDSLGYSPVWLVARYCGWVAATQHTRVGTVLSKTTIHGDTMSLKVLAKQLITATAIEALAAELRVIGNNTLTNLETLDLGADSSDNANSLMACGG